jgi:alpha,alpha-trehalose phosphorylase
MSGRGGPLSGLAAVLFDLDGVLTPTAELHQRAWADLFEPYLAARGVAPWREEDYFHFLDGRRRSDAIRALLAARGLDASEPVVEALGEAKNELFLAGLAGGVAPYPGAVELLDQLAAAGVAAAVVTSSRNGAAVLAAAGLAERFPLLVDGELALREGLAGKPSPATFLHAAGLLGVEPERAAVVEDALSGVAAGRAGGFGLVVGVDRGAGAAALVAAGADFTVGSLEELLELRLGLGDDPWALVEREAEPASAPVQETVFAVGNGLLGVRGAADEGSGSAGTFLNGFHATFPITYPEDAYGYARVGQAIVPVPDGSVLRVEVGGAVLDVAGPDCEAYERRLDFRTGVLSRDVVWRSPRGRLAVRSERFVSLVEAGTAVFSIAIEALDGDVDVAVVSELTDVTARSQDPSGLDPRRGESITGVLTLERAEARGLGGSVACRAAGSGMVVEATVTHDVVGQGVGEAALVEDGLRARIGWRVKAGETVGVTKIVRYRVAAPGGGGPGLAATALTGCDDGARLKSAQRAWLEEFWARADITCGGAPVEVQQAVRWSLFQLAQASARVAGHGIAAKGVTGSGYSGHYFWDTEVFVLPFLTHTDPAAARGVLEFRHSLLPAARRRAAELGHAGALFAWRTINGEEASAYYPAGTAQYHIDAGVAYAVAQYAAATGDKEFLAGAGAELLVETARFWADLGFFGADGLFHLHQVTGPDEYSALVDDNFYTNAMARANLLAAAEVVEARGESHEAAVWRRAAGAMALPFDAERGVHSQDAHFLEKAVWDFAGTPPHKYPLLLHYHPLNIYRRQVLKQADLVLALWLLGDEFSQAEKAADFAYYDPLTTGDSTLSAVAQQVVAAEVGATGPAWRHFLEGLAVDLLDSHGNAAHGVHIASAGGVWSMLVAGFAGFRDHGGFRLDPRLPAGWSSLVFRLALRGRRVRVEVRPEAVRLTVEEAGEGVDPVAVDVAGTPVLLGGTGFDVAVGVGRSARVGE